jgi:ABC-type lipoprotein export system ATPase subunit
MAEVLFSICRDLNIMLVLATHSHDIAAMADTRLHLDARPSSSLAPE